MATVAAIAAVLLACSGPIGETPRPTAADFEGLVAGLHTRGIAVSDVRSGDPGCDDPDLIGPAISFHAAGLDQADPALVRLYIFRNRDSYDRRRADVDACALAFITDPSTFEALDAPPFVAVGAGPWGPEFRERDARDADRWFGGTRSAEPEPRRQLRRPGGAYSTRRPRSFRAMTRRWIWLVPSPISVSFASRRKRSTLYSST